MSFKIKTARRVEIDKNKLMRSYQQSRALEFVKSLKAQPTRAELALKKSLADARYWFKFQGCFYSPTILFIYDFKLEIHAGKLIIEVDGGYHEAQQQYDAQRTAWMESNRNCVVIRFSNDEILNDLPNVMRKIDSFNPRRIGKHCGKTLRY